MAGEDVTKSPVCPDCNKPMVRISAKIEGSWTCLWLCDCRPTAEQLERWEKNYRQIEDKYVKGIVGRQHVAEV